MNQEQKDATKEAACLPDAQQHEAIKEKYRRIHSRADGLPLEMLEVVPKGEVKGIVQICHGMQEHKERYLDFMDFLANQGYACVAHDHRGHGGSVRDPKDLGYFYDETADAIVDDINDVQDQMRLKYPHVPVYLFGHSMGSLVARKYLKKYDDRIDGLILSGAVYENPGAKAGLKLVKLIARLRGDDYISEKVQKLIDGSFDKNIEGDLKNRWLSCNEENVKAFNADEKCGFPFTLNGYSNLLQLVLDVFSDKGWQMKHPDLPILFLAGEEDPVIGGKEEFEKSQQALRDRGYRDVSAKLFKNMRHEILNEVNRMDVYEDVLAFLEQCEAENRSRKETEKEEKEK